MPDQPLQMPALLPPSPLSPISRPLSSIPMLVLSDQVELYPHAAARHTRQSLILRLFGFLLCVYVNTPCIHP